MKTGRDWSDVAMSQGTPGTTEEERVKEGNVLEASEGAWPCQQIDFRLLASRYVSEYLSIVFKTPSLWYFVDNLGNYPYGSGNFLCVCWEIEPRVE